VRPRSHCGKYAHARERVAVSLPGLSDRRMRGERVSDDFAIRLGESNARAARVRASALNGLGVIEWRVNWMAAESSGSTSFISLWHCAVQASAACKRWHCVIGSHLNIGGAGIYPGM
jgi:hypothetical protein